MSARVLEMMYDADGPYLFKGAASVLDYPFDWRDWLANESDSIGSQECTAVGVVLDSSSHAGGIVTPWVSGGTAGTTATITCKITTVDDRVETRTYRLKIIDR